MNTYNTFRQEKVGLYSQVVGIKNFSRKPLYPSVLHHNKNMHEALPPNPRCVYFQSMTCLIRSTPIWMNYPLKQGDLVIKRNVAREKRHFDWFINFM